ncbi:hypothetical protein SKAU_G00356660 [Synaphobranchus kaupii]|uniref:Uncharacterized protein n=1 Tax=Synaphobranchus kaupii TaxID=118154 RepID=A0A9Q1IFP7_SYNKA|nr:hypothetical protein SKAU_G00356660 [Synaphobranchus kaupii]
MPSALRDGGWPAVITAPFGDFLFTAGSGWVTEQPQGRSVPSERQWALRSDAARDGREVRPKRQGDLKSDIILGGHLPLTQVSTRRSN